MKKKIAVILLVIALVVPTFGSVSASCPSCGGPSLTFCSGMLVEIVDHGFCPSNDENTVYQLYNMYNWVECVSYPEHTILVEGHTCFCTGCSISTCPGTGYCPY